MFRAAGKRSALLTISPCPTPHLLTTTYYPRSLSQLLLSGPFVLVCHPPGLMISLMSSGHTMLMGSISRLNSHLLYPAVPMIGQHSVAMVLTRGAQFGAAVTAYIHSDLNGDHSPDHFQKHCHTVCRCSTMFLTSFGGRTHTTMTRIIWCDSRQI
ncbi:hypothetical protein C8R45DRAFT_1033949, partial [Mycena sanguinolenta]